MKITVEKPATWTRRLIITIPADKLAQEKQTTARKLAQKVRLPGFRQGKVPTQVLEKRFGPAIEQETIERVVGEAYRAAIKQENLHPITQAEIDNIDYETGSDLTFNVGFEIRPEVELNQLGGFSVRKQLQPITDDSVDGVIQRLREQHAVWQPLVAEPPVLGDMAVVEITPIENGTSTEPRRYQIFLGEGQVRPEIEEHIRTMKPGDTGEFEVDLPEDSDDPNSPLKQHHIKVNLIEARRPQFPVLDDEFAKSVGGFDSVAGLRQRVRTDLEHESESHANQDARRQLLDQILQANPFEVPGTMVTRYLESVIKPRPEDDPAKIQEMRDNSRPQAEQAIKRMLVIERIAELEGLHAEPAELDAHFEALGTRYGRSAREIRAQLKKEGRDREVEEQLTEDKVFRYLESLSTIE